LRPPVAAEGKEKETLTAREKGGGGRSHGPSKRRDQAKEDKETYNFPISPQEAVRNALLGDHALSRGYCWEDVAMAGRGAI